MRKTLAEFRDRPLLDIVSYGRAGLTRSVRLSAEQIAAISRTVRRTPEVMVKVLPKDSNNLRSVSRHLSYIGRDGNLELETDDGGYIQCMDAGQRLLEDWDLDLEEHRKQTGLASVSGRSPKLVHKVVLSMPPGTSPKGVLEAARNFAREEFALKHRYVLVLHTDEPHPHVHLVVKAVSEQGTRLHIGPPTLRQWRSDFARRLREQGQVTLLNVLSEERLASTRSTASIAQPSAVPPLTCGSELSRWRATSQGGSCPPKPASQKSSKSAGPSNEAGVTSARPSSTRASLSLRNKSSASLNKCRRRKQKKR